MLVGKKFIHPVHGELTIIRVSEDLVEELIGGIWRQGKTVHAVFDRVIPGVRFRLFNDSAELVSGLVFHEYFLQKLKEA